MKAEILRKGLIHLKTRKTTEISKAILRFEEHYESPNSEFRHRPFTLGEFRKWYTKEMGKFSYYTDWKGFNIPGHIFEPFKEGLFDPLTDGEKEVLKLVSRMRGSFYVIATSEQSDAETLEHEICHALWYLEPDYQKEAQRILKPYIPHLNKAFFPWLEKNGYAPTVFLDEANAYITADAEWLLDRYKIEVPEELYLALRSLKDCYPL